MGGRCAGVCLGSAMAILYAGPAFSQTLNEAVAQAIANHPEMKAAAANWRAVIESAAQARAQFFPSIEASLGDGREKTDSPLTRSLGSPQVLTRREARINLAQLLFDGGGTSSQSRREQARAASAYSQLANAAESVAFRTSQAFFEVMRLRSIIAIAEQNVAVHERTLDQIAKRTESGVGRRSDERQTDARVALARSSLAQLRGQLRQAEAAYRQMTGQPAGKLVPGDIPLGVVPSSVQAAVEQALANHPAVLAAKLDLQAAEADRDLARARYSPRVTLEVSASQNHDLDGLKGLNADRTAMVMLRQNLFHGGADTARIRETAARRDEAAARLAKVQAELERDVRQAWEGLASDRARLPELRRYADVSDEVVQAYRGQFNIAQRSLLDVLNAENEAFNARSGEVGGDYAIATDVYRVLSNMGLMTGQLGAKLPEEAQ